MPTPTFPDVTVVLGDPRLPDVTKVDAVFSAEDHEAIARLRAALDELDGYRFTYLDDHTALIDVLRDRPPSFVFNCCDTGFRNVAAHELHVPALLEMFGVPYTGSGPACMGLGFDKANVRAIARDAGLDVPRQLAVGVGEPLDVLEALEDFALPLICKPNRADGSYGITQDSVVHDLAAARARVEVLRTQFPGQAVLVQEFLTGAEYAVLLIGNPGAGFRTLPPLVVDYSGLDAGLPKILGYESKTVPTSAYWQQLKYRPAELDPATHVQLVDRTTVLFERLGCRDYARFDLRAGADGRLRLLEVNPNPAWCWDGKMNLMAEFEGLSYSGLLAELLAVAQRRVATA